MQRVSNIAHVYYFYAGLSSFLLSCNDFSLQTNERCCELHKNVDENAAGCCPIALLSCLVPYFLSEYGSFFTGGFAVLILFPVFQIFHSSSMKLQLHWRDAVTNSCQCYKHVHAAHTGAPSKQDTQPFHNAVSVLSQFLRVNGSCWWPQWHQVYIMSTFTHCLWWVRTTRASAEYPAKYSVCIQLSTTPIHKRMW